MTSGTTDTTPLRDRLRAALPTAMKARDRGTVAVLRSAIAAIDNAESVDIGTHRASALEGSALGPGAAEVARKHLTEADIAAVVRTEIAERVRAADEYESTGRPDRATELRAEADTLASFL